MALQLIIVVYLLRKYWTPNPTICISLRHIRHARPVPCARSLASTDHYLRRTTLGTYIIRTHRSSPELHGLSCERELAPTFH